MEASEHEDGRRRRRSYDEAFKRDAVRLVAEEKYSFKAAATAVNVSEQSLRAGMPSSPRPRRPAASTPPSKSCATRSPACESSSSGRSWNAKS